MPSSTCMPALAMDPPGVLGEGLNEGLRAAEPGLPFKGVLCLSDLLPKGKLAEL